MYCANFNLCLVEIVHFLKIEGAGGTIAVKPILLAPVQNPDIILNVNKTSSI